MRIIKGNPPEKLTTSKESYRIVRIHDNQEMMRSDKKGVEYELSRLNPKKYRIEKVD